MTRRHERQLVAVLFAFVSATLAALTTVLFRVTKRHGETLLQLENVKTSPFQPPPPPVPDQTTLLNQHGAPAGSVAMNFELPAVDGESYTLTLLKGKRTLLIFTAVDCPYSLQLLPALAELPPATSEDDLHIAIISTGEMTANRELVEQFGIPFPVLVQERHEVADLYYASGTPMAYLLGFDGLTELNRIEGAQAILGVALAATRRLERMPDQWHQPLPPTPNPIDIPLRAGDLLPDLSAVRLGGGQFTQNDLIGKRTLLFMFDPFCAPCINLLPDFARIHADPRQPDVAMIARRDPSHMFELARAYDLPYPIAFQDNWEISRRIGAQVVPAAFIVGADLRLESEIAVGQQVIADLHRRLRQEHADRRLVSLSALLQRR